MGIFSKDNKNENDKIIDIQVSTPETTLKIKKLFLIDYENVADAGVVGVDTLTADDTVIIFYGSKIKSVAYESLIAITSSAASIEHLKAEKTAKNYLDFQLTTYLGYKLGKEHFDEICVVSKDSGFDAVVDFWMEKGYSIRRQDAVVVTEKPAASEEKPKQTHSRNKSSSKSRATRSSKSKVVTKPQAKATAKPARPTVTEKQKSELRTALKEAELKAPDYKKVYDAFASSDSTLAYNNKLQKSFDNEKTSLIYKATVKIFENTISKS